MSETFDPMKRWHSPTVDDLASIAKLMDPAIPLEQSAGRLPASGAGMMRTHHHRPVGYDAQADRIAALRELANERLMASRGVDGPAREAAMVEFLRCAKAAKTLETAKGAAKGAGAARAPARQKGLDLEP